jgi:hypothetical protein
MTELNENNEQIVSIKAPRLDPVEKLYVRAYLSKLSHSYAHKVVCPDIKKGLEDNQFSRRENIKFHISLALQEQAEALDINAPKIIERLYKEAIREDKSSSHNARIQALGLLGKHFGLFEEKKKSDTYTFNIVNYGSSEKQEEIVISKSISKDDIEEDTTGIELTDYREEK